MLGHGLRLRCPRCGIGRLYGKPFRMNENCAHCGLKFEREQGYFIGAIYINYAATIAIAVPGFFLLDAFTGIDINQQLAFWIPFAVIFPLLFFIIQEVCGWCWIISAIRKSSCSACHQGNRRISDYRRALVGIVQSRTNSEIRAMLPPGSAWTMSASSDNAATSSFRWRDDSTVGRRGRFSNGESSSRRPVSSPARQSIGSRILSKAPRQADNNRLLPSQKNPQAFLLHG